MVSITSAIPICNLILFHHDIANTSPRFDHSSTPLITRIKTPSNREQQESFLHSPPAPPPTPPTMKQVASSEEFSTLVNNGKVVCLFSATWCGPCVSLKDNISKAGLEEKLSKEKNITCCVVDVDELDDLSEKYGIEAMPTTLFFNGSDKPVGNKMVGGKPVADFEKAVLEALDA